MELSMDAIKVVRAVRILQMKVIAIKEKQFYNYKINKQCKRLILVIYDNNDNYQYYSYWKTIKSYMMPVDELEFEPELINDDDDTIDIGTRYFIEMNYLPEELFKYSDERYYEMMDMVHNTHTNDSDLFLREHIEKIRNNTI